MKTVNDKSITIYDALQNIKSNKYIIPAFQREFVWDITRIEKLWDSILLDYLLSTFLFWHIDDSNTTWDTYFLSFLSGLTFDSRNQPDKALNKYFASSINTNFNDTAVLDGQQRLTALYVSLYGDLKIRKRNARRKNNNGITANLYVELNKNKLKVDEEEYNSKKFDIRFNTKLEAMSPTSFEIKKLIDENIKDEVYRTNLFNQYISKTPENSRDYATKLLNKLYEKIYVEKLVRYTEIFGMTQDDALELFVRFNSGGKPLKKSEITMSILEAYWSQAKQEFNKVLVNEYSSFSTDFIIRIALMLYGDVIKSTINSDLATQLKTNWNSFKLALKNLSTFLTSLKIDIKRFANSWNVLLPIIYVIYYNPSQYLNYTNELRAYLIRAIFFGYFSSGTTGKLQQMKSDVNSFGGFITFDLLNQRSELAVTQGKLDDLLMCDKGSKIAGEILYYLSKDWINPLFNYEQDHLHPYERFNESKPLSVSYDDWSKWKILRNKLPNLQYFEGKDNAGKSDIPLEDYLSMMTKEQQDSFKEHALIPNNVSLKFEDFGKFFEERSKLLIAKIKLLLN